MGHRHRPITSLLKQTVWAWFILVVVVSVVCHGSDVDGTTAKTVTRLKTHKPTTELRSSVVDSSDRIIVGDAAESSYCV